MIQEFKSTHAAMATEFTLIIRHSDEAYARGASQAVWNEVDRIEDLLSRFKEGSDIYCVNHSTAGATVPLREETDMCLRLAIRIMQATSGVFDVGVGALSEALEKSGLESPAALKDALEKKGKSSLVLHEDSPHITVLEPGMKLDLGAIGKGFAVDWTQSLLGDYEIDYYLLSSGGSSVLVNVPEGKEPWKIRLVGDKKHYIFKASQCSISASGTGVNGFHIVDPKKGKLESYPHKRSWAISQSAAVSDALATAVLLMDEPSIKRALLALDEKTGVVLEPNDPDNDWIFLSHPEDAFVPEDPNDPESAWVLK